jgi:hypothetical protein
MTNYDRWKLATPDYLEDTNEEESLHGDFIGGEDWEKPCSSDKSNTTYAQG